jgi:hypothetical protein
MRSKLVEIDINVKRNAAQIVSFTLQNLTIRKKAAYCGSGGKGRAQALRRARRIPLSLKERRQSKNGLRLLRGGRLGRMLLP